MVTRSTQPRRVIVALDGPASSGKSSVGSAAAAQLQLRFVDTGLFYRAVTALALRDGVATDDATGLVSLVGRVSLGDDGSARLTRVLLDGEDATDEARSAVVDASVSAVSRVPEVRQALLGRQRELAAEGGIVVAGRDIGTVVLPDADLKLFLDASIEERAKRRIEERGLDPAGDEAEDVREQLRIRDAIDTTREVSPLRAADDAVHIVTDGNVFDDTVEIIAAEIARVMLTPRKTTRARPKATLSRTATAAAAAAQALGATEPVDDPPVVTAPEPVDPGPFTTQGDGSNDSPAHPFLGPFAVSSEVDAAPWQPPAVQSADPEPVDPGPFTVDQPVAEEGLAHPLCGPFAVAADVEIARPAPPAALPVEIDPGPFGIAVAVAGDTPANPAAGPFAVSSDVDATPTPSPVVAEAVEPEAVEPEPPVPVPVFESAPPAPRPVAPVVEPRKLTRLETAMQLDNDQTMLVRMAALVARIGARAFANVQVEGFENIPRKGAVILAGNHMSNADSVIVGGFLTAALKRRRIHWLGKRELFDWPIFGWIAANGGIHPVQRDGADIEAFRLATRILDKGYILAVFPEGTRSPSGEIQEPKDGVALLAMRSGAQVVPIGISNSDTVWKKGQKWPNPVPRETITVRIGTPFRVQDVIPEGTDRRVAKGLATTAIMTRIAALVDPRHRGVYADSVREAANHDE